MSEMQAETQPAPEAAPARRPRRAAAVAAQAAEPAVETAQPVVGEGAPTEPAPTADTAPVVAPAVEAAPPPASAAEAPPAPARRGRRATAALALDLALPGVRTAEILAELDRRQHRAKALLAERERVIREMEEIKAALDGIGKSPP